MRLGSSRLMTVVRKKRGVSSAEYAVLALCILVAVASALALPGDPTTGIYGAPTSALTSAINDVSSAPGGR